MIAADTSVLVAAFASWHESHAAALAALPDVRLVGHCVVETYSVLTRLPPPHRVPPPLAAGWLDRIATTTPLTLPPRQLRDLPGRMTDRGIAGGAAYDALVAATALHHAAELVSLDVRAVATYRSIGVAHRLLA